MFGNICNMILVSLFIDVLACIASMRNKRILSVILSFLAFVLLFLSIILLGVWAY